MHTATATLKATARKLANATGADFRTAFARISESVTDLRIARVRYNRNVRSWEISAADADRLVDTLTESTI